MEIHNPNVFGSVSAAGNEGIAGQHLQSAGPGLQAVWATPADNSFTFTSASSVSHVINHNLGNQFPSITVWETATNGVIAPDTIIGNTVNQLTITFFVARAIAGTIAG